MLSVAALRLHVAKPTPTIEEYKAIKSLTNMNPERAAKSLVLSTDATYKSKKKKLDDALAKIQEWIKTKDVKEKGRASATAEIAALEQQLSEQKQIFAVFDAEVQITAGRLAHAEHAMEEANEEEAHSKIAKDDAAHEVETCRSPPWEKSCALLFRP
jgi:chromosome segregation ATPase